MKPDPTADRQVALSEQPGPPGEPVITAPGPLEDEPEPETGSNTHASLARGLAILAMLIAEKQPMALATIAERMGMHRSTAHHILKAMVATGHLKQLEVSRAYEPGRALEKMMGDLLGVKIADSAGRRLYHSPSSMRESFAARNQQLYERCKELAQEFRLHIVRLDSVQMGHQPMDLTISFQAGRVGTIANVLKARNIVGTTGRQEPKAQLQALEGLSEAAEITPSQWESFARPKSEKRPEFEDTAPLIRPNEEGGGLQT